MSTAERNARMLALLKEGPKVFPVDDLVAGLQDVKERPALLLPVGGAFLGLGAAEGALAGGSIVMGAVMGLLGFLAVVFLMIGALRLGLAIVDGRKPQLAVLGQGGDVLVPATIALGTMALILAFANMVVFVFSGVVMKTMSYVMWLALIPPAWLALMYVTLTRTLRWAFAIHLVADKRLGAARALERSTAISEGQRHRLLAFVALAFVLNVVGALLAGLGLLVTVPATTMATVRIYRRLNPRQAANKGDTRPLPRPPAPGEEAAS